MLKWMVLAYVGEPGGVTSWGNVRHVFYSNTAAPLIEEIIRDAKAAVVGDMRVLATDKDIKSALGNQHVARRFEQLLDILSVEV